MIYVMMHKIRREWSKVKEKEGDKKKMEEWECVGKATENG